MSLDECAAALDAKPQKPKGPRHVVLCTDDVIDSYYDPHQVFRFRGRLPGRNGGAIVTVRYSSADSTLTAGVSICTPSDVWNPEKWIKNTIARMNSAGTKRRPNKWRFKTIVRAGAPTQRDYYEFARRCLHNVFILRQFSTATVGWFKRQLPWVAHGRGLLKTTGRVTVG